MARAIVSSGLQQGVVETSTIDLPGMTRTGAASLSLADTQTRYQTISTFQDVRQGSLGSLSLNIGFTYDRSNFSNRWDALNGIEQILTEGAPHKLFSGTLQPRQVGTYRMYPCLHRMNGFQPNGSL